jgi:hypothetical protein
MTATDKVDLFKLHKDEYVAPKKPRLVSIGTARYLAASGQGGPGGEEFGAKVGALYAVAFTIKMTRKFEGKGDYMICKLEAQYWCDDEDRGYQTASPEDWRWRLMIRTPDFVTQRDLDDAIAKLLEKGKDPTVSEVALIDLAEGDCVQMLHVGPYEREEETLATMLELVENEGLVTHGRHHEIYLSDPRRVEPERLRTILRMPVQ